MGEMADYVNDIGGYGDVYWPVKKNYSHFKRYLKLEISVIVADC